MISKDVLITTAIALGMFLLATPALVGAVWVIVWSVEWTTTWPWPSIN